MQEPTTKTLDFATRMKRARMRAWRRGMKETDLLLGGFIDNKASEFDEPLLAVFERLLERQDQQLYAWISNGARSQPEDAGPDEIALIQRIAVSVT